MNSELLSFSGLARNWPWLALDLVLTVAVASGAVAALGFWTWHWMRRPDLMQDPETLTFAGFMIGIMSIVLLRLAWTVVELLRQRWLDSRKLGTPRAAPDNPEVQAVAGVRRLSRQELRRKAVGYAGE